MQHKTFKNKQEQQWGQQQQAWPLARGGGRVGAKLVGGGRPGAARQARAQQGAQWCGESFCRKLGIAMNHPKWAQGIAHALALGQAVASEGRRERSPTLFRKNEENEQKRSTKFYFNTNERFFSRHSGNMTTFHVL